MSIPSLATQNAIKLGTNSEFKIAPDTGIQPDGLNTTAIYGSASIATVSAAHYGIGNGLTRTVLTLTAVPVTITDNGANGSGGVKIYDFPECIFVSIAASANCTVAYGSVTDANVIASLGSVVAAADATLTSTEANIIPSTSAATTAGAGTFAGDSTAVTVLNGTSTAVDLYLNLATSTDPSTNNSATVSGTITLIWANGGDN